MAKTGFVMTGLIVEDTQIEFGDSFYKLNKVISENGANIILSTKSKISFIHIFFFNIVWKKVGKSTACQNISIGKVQHQNLQKAPDTVRAIGNVTIRSM